MEENLNIVLIGMPGGGKSYIGSKLAKLLAHFNYVDIDNEIEQSTGMEISEIFEKHGEGYFRKLESQKIQEYSQNRNQIISVGGGAFQREKNIKALQQNGLIFYLKASSKELFNRIQHETHRPLFKKDFSQKAIDDLLKKRKKNYLKANFVIDTDQKQAYTILDDILKEYDEYVK